MMKRVDDIHLHLFDKSVINFRILLEVIKLILKHYDTYNKENKISFLQLIRRIINFTRVGISKNPEKIFINLKQQLKVGKYVCVPLTFDLECAVSNPINVSETIIKRFNRIGNISYLKKTILKKLFINKSNIDSRINVEMGTYDKQLFELNKLKDKYPEEIYPFINLDPRREDLVNQFIDKLYYDKDYYGVKIYAANGYSCADNLFMEEGGLYDFCQENNIPITAHCNCGGFATPENNIYIDGLVINEDNNIINKIGFIKFKQEFLDEQWVEERATTLNHPRLWREVLKKYPKLKINLAHFGHINENWMDDIFDLMNDYDNVYTDISCVTDYKEMIAIKLNYYAHASEKVKSKFLYGTDYYMDLLYAKSLEYHVNSLINIFGEEEINRMKYNNGFFLNI